MVGTALTRLCPPYPALSAVEFRGRLFHEAFQVKTKLSQGSDEK
jgi:hypothetical protein